jgi:mono/diheme cytochrome c family protein
MLLVVAPACAQNRSGLVAQGEQLFTVQGCHGCHTVGKAGTPIGPDLSYIGAKYAESFLLRWLSDPTEQRPTAHMPKIQLTPAEVEALGAYLASLR